MAADDGFDVRKSGVIADGSVDVTRTLQALLDSGKVDLTFPKGEYFLGTLNLPKGTHLRFEWGARLKVNPATLSPILGEAKNEKSRPPVRDTPLFKVVGDGVTIEGLWFDFASGATEKKPTPVDALVYASGVSDVTVTRAYAQTTYDRELIPLEKRTRFESPWRRAPSAPKEEWKNSMVLLKAEDCRNVVLENSGATFISIMIEALRCANVTSRGNWMISGLTIATFSGGSESLKHYGNWSRDVNYQAVWRGGSPDPSRKAPEVPHGTANVVHRGSKAGDADWIPHTSGTFDVLIENNYAEYGNTLCWGNKCRQVVIRGNTARFISDYSYGTEGGENIVYANNISINSTSGGIVSMYWGENLLITGNQILVKHEPWTADYSRFPKASSYLGSFVRLHHGPSNKEDRYGAGTIMISNNLFVNELSDVSKGIGIQPGRDVTISGNKFVNGKVSRAGEERPGEGKLTVIDNEFVSRLKQDYAVINIGAKSSAAIIRGNVIRREEPVEKGTEKERSSEKDAVPYFLFADKEDEKQEVESQKKDVSLAAIQFATAGSTLAIVQNNVIVGWKDAVLAVASKKGSQPCVISGNTTDGTIAVDDPQNLFPKVIGDNRSLQNSEAPPKP